MTIRMRPRPFLRVGVIQMVFALATSPATAQRAMDASGPADCEGKCLSVTISQVIESPPEVGFDRDDLSRAAATPEGDILIAPRNWTGTILRFRSGVQIGRYGRAGEGPGESKGIRSLAVGVGDSLHAFGAMTRNVFDLDGEGFRAQRDEFFPVASNVMFESGEVHVAMVPPLLTVEGAELIMLPLGDGRLESAVPIPTSIDGASVGQSLVLSSTSSDCLAVGYRGRYRVDVFDSELELVTTVQRSVPWFTPWEEWVPPTEGPSDTRMSSVMIDCERGHLWVQMLVAEDEDFEPYPFSRARELLDRGSRTHDTLIEVISLDDGSVLASQRFDSVWGYLLHGGHVLEPFVSDAGEQGYRVLRLALPEPH